MATDAHRRARARREPERAAGGADGVVELADGGARLGPRLSSRRVDVDRPESGEVQHREGLVVVVEVDGGVGEALVVVPAAAHADADAVAAAAAHGGLRVGVLGGRDDP